MSLSNKISMGVSLLRSKITGYNFPFMVNWAITGRCNLRCIHCYGDYGESQTAELPLELVKETIDKLKKMGTKRFTIEGGEPLFRKDIAEILQYIYDNGMEYSLCSNGIYLSRYIDVVRETCDLLVMSLDGIESRHDKLRGKNTYQKTIEALELAHKHKIKTLLFTCLIDDNVQDIDTLVALTKKYNTRITFNIAVAKIENGDLSERKTLNKLADNNYRLAIKKIQSYKKAGAPIYYSDQNYEQALNWPTFSKEKYWDKELDNVSKKEKKTMIPCYAGKRFIYIECNGDVYPCYQMVGTMTVKNIEKDGIEEAFKFLNKESYCTRCYNLTLSELNLQANLNLDSIKKVVKNYG